MKSFTFGVLFVASDGFRLCCCPLFGLPEDGFAGKRDDDMIVDKNEE